MQFIAIIATIKARYGAAILNDAARLECPKPPIIGCTLVEPGGAHTDFRNRCARVAGTLAAYNASPSRIVNRIIADTTRPSPGDPAKMVEAMIASVDQEPTPRRIALGSDAYQVMRPQLSARLEAMEAQRELACSTY